jgi:hypothetical protein
MGSFLWKLPISLSLSPSSSARSSAPGLVSAMVTIHHRSPLSLTGCFSLSPSLSRIYTPVPDLISLSLSLALSLYWDYSPAARHGRASICSGNGHFALCLPVSTNIFFLLFILLFPPYMQVHIYISNPKSINPEIYCEYFVSHCLYLFFPSTCVSGCVHLFISL